MTVQWTGHIPQAMQRHGASLKPCGDPADRRTNTKIQSETLPKPVEPDMPAQKQAA